MSKSERAWPAELRNVKVTDRFWNLYVSQVSSKMIPYQWRVLNDVEEGAEKSGCIRNFRIAAGEETGEFHGFVFQDTDLAKWLEAVAYSLSLSQNPALEAEADEAIALIGRAQRTDGYLNTYFTIREPGKEFTNLREGHELYTAGHMMEAACAYYENTGKDSFLKICIRLADLICRKFHEERYANAVPGHQEIELGLIRMYRVTGERRYLDMAKEFIDRRGTEPNNLVHEHERSDWTDVFFNRDAYFPVYGQCDRPVREQKTAEGHAVRAMYMYAAMADLAWEYHDDILLDTCRTIYRDITERQMYLTGGIGQSGLYERFTTAYDLPNDRNYAESCASIGLAMFCSRMAQITHEEKYVSTMETALYNTVAAEGAVMLRVPGYAGDPVITFADGRTMKPRSGAFAEIPFGEGEQSITLRFDMEPHFVYANPKVRADAGKAAVVRGPLVYVSEQVDNGENLASFEVDTSVLLREISVSGLPEGCRGVMAAGTKIIDRDTDSRLYTRKRPETEPAELRLIPYCFWGNRQTGEMMVWHREKR